MVVQVAKNAGFCGGVHRAFLMVEKKFKNSKNKPRALILGSLVHNENVTSVIEKWGIKKIKNLRNVKKGDVVIITAHGVSSDKIRKIKEKGARVFDVTCPNVSKVHKTVSEYNKKGYIIAIYGDKKHKEVRGINGWCNNKAYIIGNRTEIQRFVKKLEKDKLHKPILLVSQTTQNINKFDQAAEAIKKAARETQSKVKIINTICSATFLRQSEAKKFAKNNGGIVVVGGKKSANTKQLWKIAKQQNKNVIWIDELNEGTKKRIKKALSGVNKVAILSGASTPNWDIAAAVKFIKSL